MSDIMKTEHRIRLDSLIEAFHTSTLPTYPIRRESFLIHNSYISPIQLIEFEFNWWHRDFPEGKFSQIRKNMNKVIEPTVSHEEIIEIDLNQLKKYNIEKSDIDGKIYYQMLFKIKLDNIYITKEIIGK